MWFLNSCKEGADKPSNTEDFQIKLCEDQGSFEEMQEFCGSWGAGRCQGLFPEHSGLFCFDPVSLFYFFPHWINVKALKTADTPQAFDPAEWNPIGLELLLSQTACY